MAWEMVSEMSLGPWAVPQTKMPSLAMSTGLQLDVGLHEIAVGVSRQLDNGGQFLGVGGAHPGAQGQKIRREPEVSLKDMILEDDRETSFRRHSPEAAPAGSKRKK